MTQLLGQSVHSPWTPCVAQSWDPGPEEPEAQTAPPDPQAPGASEGPFCCISSGRQVLWGARGSGLAQARCFLLLAGGGAGSRQLSALCSPGPALPRSASVLRVFSQVPEGDLTLVGWQAWGRLRTLSQVPGVSPRTQACGAPAGPLRSLGRSR